jgi:hypothetical protein
MRPMYTRVSLTIFFTAMSGFMFLVHTSSWQPKRPWSAGALHSTLYTARNVSAAIHLYEDEESDEDSKIRA